MAGLGALMAESFAHAGEPTVKECLSASEASLKLGNDYKLRAERAQLLICASASCPNDIRKECLRRVDEVNLAIPSIVFEAKDAQGNDLSAVKVTMDGELLAERLRGIALPVDPGEHTFRFEVAGKPAIEKQLLIREAQKDRHETISVTGPASQGKNADSGQAAAVSTEGAPTVEKPGGSASLQPTGATPSNDQVPVVPHAGISNLLTLGIQQDYLYHSDSTNVCAPGSLYECFQGTGQRVLAEDSATVHSQVIGSGFSSGTLRVLAGYDRFVLPQLSVGLRVGAVVSGKPAQTSGDASFFAFHGEGRAAFWLVHDPLRSSFSPYVLASIGAAEADVKVQVRYQDPATNCPDCRLNAWKRGGFEFMSAGLGVIAVITNNSGPLLEARYVYYLGKSASSLAGQLGYAVGF